MAHNNTYSIDSDVKTLDKFSDHKVNLNDLELLQILEQNPNVIVITNTRGEIEYVNPRFSQLTGYSREEVMGQNPRILKSGDKSPQFYKNLWATVSAGKTWQGEFLNKKKNGELFWENASIGAIKNNDGLITHYVAIKNDITARKQAEQALAHSELRFRNLTQTAKDAIISVNENGKATFWNAAAEKMFGYAAKEMIGKDIHSYIVPEKYQKAAYQNLPLFKINGKGAAIGKTIEMEGKHLNGKIFPVELSISSMCINGKWQAMAILRDISKRKQTEKRLKQNKQRLRQILNNVMGGIIVIDAKTLTIEDANDAACRILDKKLDDLIGASCCQYICKKKGNACPAKATNSIINKELFIQHKDGTRIPIVKNVVKTTIDGKEVFIENFIDISQRLQAEEQLKRSLLQNQQLLRSISSGLILMDESESIVFLNKRAQELFKLDSKKILGKNLMQSGIQWQWDKILMAISECRLTRASQVLEDISYEVARQHTSGFLKVTVSPYLGSTGEYPGFLILAEDITEYKILQSQLSQAQKLESIGQLAAGIAHEINTPIQFVGDNTRFLKDAFSDVRLLLDKYAQLTSGLQAHKEAGPLLKEIESLKEEIDLDYLMDETPSAIKQSLDGINRVAKIVKAMKEFSHPGNNKEKTPIDLNKAIANTIIVCRNEWKYVAEMQTEFADNMPPVPCFPDPLNQVILNLIINASHTIKDALTERGEKMGIIKISTKYKNKTAIISVSDTGMGIPKEIQKRIFDPFFTTKEVGKGTGQGLAISFDVIVNKHGGKIHFKSTPGKGTTFIIELPLEME